MLLVKAYQSYTVMVDENTLNNDKPIVRIVFRGGLYDANTFRKLKGDGPSTMYGYTIEDYKKRTDEIAHALEQLKASYTAPTTTPAPATPETPKDDF